MFCKNCGSQVPEGIAFCASCGTPVAGTPAAAAPAAAAPKADKSGLIKLIAIILAIAVVAGLFIGLLGGNSPKSVAKKYVMAQLEGDLKTRLSLSPGKYQKYYEEEVYGDDDDAEQLFENAEEYADELDVDVKIKNFNQYYKAMKKITKAENKEDYGKGYKFSVKVVDMKDMRNSDLEDIQDMYDNDEMEDYINPDKIKKGKKVYVKVDIDSDENPSSEIVTVYTVKYGSQWKVVYVTGDDRDNGDD